MFNFFDIKKNSENYQLSLAIKDLNNKGLEPLWKLLENQLLFYIKEIYKESVYNKNAEGLFLKIEGILDFLTNLSFNYDYKFTDKISFFIKEFIRLDDLGSREYLFKNIKNGDYKEILDI